jgi:aryl-alcohol dehydrogenase-like predicted oxidoreductase
MRLSVHASLQKLRTTYIDLVSLAVAPPLYPLIIRVRLLTIFKAIPPLVGLNSFNPELMQSLNTPITEGKVLYLSISDAPA